LKSLRSTAFATTAFVAAMSCATPGYADGGNQFFGTLLGAGIGGLIGSQFGHGGGRTAFTVGGVLLGGAVGNSLGAAADQQERGAYAGGGYYASPEYYYQSPVYYANTYVPTYVAPPAPPPASIAYYDPSVQTYCREFTQETRIEGQAQEIYGTACLQPDGSWRVAQ